MVDLEIEAYFLKQGLTSDQFERAKRLLDVTNLDAAEAAIAACLSDGEIEGDVVRRVCPVSSSDAPFGS